MKFDLFISYSRRDFDEVSSILEKIKTAIPNLSYWFDIDGIESGDEFEDKIISAIDNSSYVLFALSENSIESQWTKDEVMYAKNTDKKVIPVLLKGAQMKGWFLFKFGRVDCIDSTNALQMEKLLHNLSDWTGKNSVTGHVTEPGIVKNPEQLCPCGSGKLFKDCHGSVVVQVQTLSPVASVQRPVKRANSINNAEYQVKSGFLCPCGSGRLYKDCHGGPSMQYDRESSRPYPVGRIWQVGDYYNFDGKEGVVFWVDESRNHGKIISMDHSNLQWCLDKENKKGVITNANNREDGKRNSQFLISIDDWKNKYPALLWCLNHGDDWYLPAIDELEELLLNKEVHDRVNKTLKEKNATQLFDRGQGRFYWSSTEEGLWEAWAIDLSFGFSFHYRRRGKCYVRAVSAF